MRLEEYLEEFGTTIPKLAKKANLSAITVRDVVNQRRDPQLSTALSIEAATKGQVTCRELLPKKLLEQMLEVPFRKKGQGDSKKPPKGIVRWAEPLELDEENRRMDRMLERSILEKSLASKKKKKKKKDKK